MNDLSFFLLVIFYIIKYYHCTHEDKKLNNLQIPSSRTKESIIILAVIKILAGDRICMLEDRGKRLDVVSCWDKIGQNSICW